MVQPPEASNNTLIRTYLNSLTQVGILNIQNEDGWAKPYQVRQFIKIIEKYDLQEDQANVRN